MSLALRPPGRIYSNSDSPSQKGDAPFPSRSNAGLSGSKELPAQHPVTPHQRGRVPDPDVSPTPPHPNTQQQTGRHLGVTARKAPCGAKAHGSYSHERDGCFTTTTHAPSEPTGSCNPGGIHTPTGTISGEAGRVYQIVTGFGVNQPDLEETEGCTSPNKEELVDTNYCWGSHPCAVSFICPQGSFPFPPCPILPPAHPACLLQEEAGWIQHVPEGRACQRRQPQADPSSAPQRKRKQGRERLRQPLLPSTGGAELPKPCVPLSKRTWHSRWELPLQEDSTQTEPRALPRGGSAG